MLSRQSELYIKLLAAAVANLDVLYDFFEYRVTNKSKMNLIIMSDHGVVRSLWESELSNHGEPKSGNESFLFVYDKAVQRSRKPLEWEHTPRETPGLSTSGEANSLLENQPEILGRFPVIQSYEVVSTLTQLFAHANVPINSIGNPKPLSQRNSFQLKRLRMVEMQVYQYFMSFQSSPSPSKQSSKDQPSHPVARKIVSSSPFNKIIARIDSADLREQDLKSWQVQVDGSNLASELDQYSQFVESLIADLKSQLVNKRNSDRGEKNMIISLVVIMFVVLNGVFLLFELAKSALTVKCLVLVNLGGLMLPLFCFMLLNHIDEHAFLLLIPLSIVGTLLMFIIAKRVCSGPARDDLGPMIDSNIGFLLLNLALLVFDWIVSLDNFIFFYFRSPVFQTLSVVLLIFYLSLAIKVIHLSPNRQVNSLMSGILLLLASFIIIYDIILVFSTSYLQTFAMVSISRCVYVLTFACFGGLLLVRKVGGFMLFFVFLLGVFWLGSNYLRLAFAIIVVPFLFFFMSVNKKLRNLHLKFTHAACLIILESLLLFYLLRYAVDSRLISRGRLDTNISVRAGNKNWTSNIEDSPIFTAAIFMVYKFYPFILLFLFLFAFHFTKPDPEAKSNEPEPLDQEQSKFIKDAKLASDGRTSRMTKTQRKKRRSPSSKVRPF